MKKIFSRKNDKKQTCIKVNFYRHNICTISKKKDWRKFGIKLFVYIYRNRYICEK